MLTNSSVKKKPGPNDTHAGNIYAFAHQAYWGFRFLAEKRRILWQQVLAAKTLAQVTLTGSIVPINLVSATSNGSPTPLQTLWATNQFTAPVTGARNISFGMITSGKPQKGKVPFPKEMKVDFSPQDQFATIVIAFQGIEAWKNTVQLQVYDVDNHLLTRGDPIKISLRSGETQERTWSFPLAMHPGTYRADVTVGEEVAWRAYFRISE